MQNHPKSLAPGASMLEVLMIVLITNLRLWLPIKSTSINKLALQFERLVASRWTAKPQALALAKRPDGIGAQLHGQISVLVESRKCALPYCHREIKQAAFIRSEEELERWLKVFNLAKQNDYGKGDQVKELALRDYVRWPFGDRKDCIVAAPHMHRAAEKDPDFYAGICKELRQNLQFNHLTTKQANAPVRVALHVRRGDVSDTQNSKRFTSLAVVKQSIVQLVEMLKASNIAFTIELHSQGTEADFQDLLAIHSMETHLDSDPLETIQRLISADILLTAKSSFSQIAALMSEGIILYEPYWQKPLRHWHIRQPDGSIDPSAKEAIAQMAARSTKSQPH